MNIILLGIILANILISFKGFNNSAFFHQFDFHIGSIKKGEHIRMFSSAFLHADIAHLVFNMLTLYFFAPVVITYFNSLTFLIVYAVSLIFGSLFSLYFHRNEFNYRAIGASGAVTGVLYAAILLQPDMSLYLFFIPIPIPAYLFGIGYLLYSIYGMRAKSDNIGHSAHFGGAVGGYLITIIKEPFLLIQNTEMVVLLAIPIVLLFVLTQKGKL